MGVMVSVIIPVYNGEKYISATVQSVFAQTLKDWELIIVDDCSTDRTPAICSAYQKMPGVKVLTAERNLGVSAARNMGIRSASGKYIVFLDADDILTEDSMEVRVRKMEENQLEMGVFNYFMVMDEGMPQRSNMIGLGRYKGICFLEREELYQMGCNLGDHVVWDKIFRTDTIQDKEIYFREDITAGEDIIFVWEYAAACNGWIEVEDVSVIYHHRRSGNRDSLQTQYRNGKFHQIYETTKKYFLVLFETLNGCGIFHGAVRDGFYHHYINKMIGALYYAWNNGGVEDTGILFEDAFFQAGIETYQCRNSEEDPKIIKILREKNEDRLLEYLKERVEGILASIESSQLISASSALEEKLLWSKKSIAVRNP